VQWLLPVGGGWSWEVSQGLHYIGAHFLKLHFSDPVQVASIHDWLTPMNQVQYFVGFIKFYQCFIQDFSHVAKPLHLLTQKKGKHGDGLRMNRRPSRNSSDSSHQHPSLYNLTKTCNFSWKWRHLGMPPVPSYINCTRMTNGTIGFTSKASCLLKETAKSVIDKELLSVMPGLEDWRHMIEILNDHRNLRYFQMSQKL